MKKQEALHILITGGSSGLGLAIAEAVLQQGWIPILLARRRTELQKHSERLEKKYHVTIPYYSLDVTYTNQVKAVFHQINADGYRFDVLINNAGFGIFQTLEEASIEDYKKMIEVNYLGSIYCTKEVLPQMIEKRDGHIINIASQSGKIGTPKTSAYAASKHALLGFTNSIRLELESHHIHVTAVNPGPIRTPFFDQADKSGEYVKNISSHMLDPEFVAQKVVSSILKPTREVNLPLWMNIGSRLSSLFPTLMDGIIKKFLSKK